MIVCHMLASKTFKKPGNSQGMLSQLEMGSNYNYLVFYLMANRKEGEIHTDYDFSLCGLEVVSEGLGTRL